MRKRFEEAQTLSHFIEGAEQNRAMWQSYYVRATIPAELIDAARNLPAERHLLVLIEEWCGDGLSTVPWLAKLADVVPEKLELRVLHRDENLDLMDAHLSPTGARAIPVVMVLDENFEEIGWWGSRPAALQAWVDAEGAALDKEERYLRIRQWYARDRGASAMREVLAIAAAAEEGSARP